MVLCCRRRVSCRCCCGPPLPSQNNKDNIYGEDSGSRPSHPKNGLLTAGCWSLVTWGWVNHLLRLRGQITDSDLWQLLAGDTTAVLSQRLIQAWENQKAAAAKVPGKKPSLTSAFLSVFACSYAFWAIPAWLKAGFLLTQTQLFALLLDELREDEAHFHPPRAYGYATGLILSGLFTILMHHFYFFQAWRAGMRWRMAGTALLFQKCLQLRMDALVETSAGKIINLASTDVERFQKMCQYITYMGLAPVEAIIIVWLLWREIGVASLAGVAIIAIFVAVQAVFSKMFGRLRHETAHITDERVRLTGQVVSGIRVLKMYGWEPPFLTQVQNVRNREIKKVATTSWLRGINEGLYTVAPTLVGGAAFLTYNALGADYWLTPRKIFVSMTLFSLLQLDVTKFLQLGLESLAEVKITFKRMQEFLLLPEVPAAVRSVLDDDPIRVEDLSCAWTTHSSTSFALQNMSFEVAPRSLVTVVGAVGAGKTSLLMALLGELPPSSGTVSLKGRSAYVSQNPWIISGTVRENILFGAEFDESRYRQVIRACCLERDMAGFAAGDHEVIGERGINLSGGQRARVALARACYTDADVYLLDDPLSAVDAKVGRELFENCICGYLGSKTRILVTHQLQYLRSADSIFILSHGQMVMQGSFDDLGSALAASAAAARSDPSGNTQTASNSLGTALAEILQDLDDPISDVDDITTGISRRSSRAGSTVSVLDAVTRARSLLLGESKAEDEDCVHEDQIPADAAPMPQSGAVVSPAGLVQEEKMATGSVTLGTYQKYWSAAGGCLMGVYMVFLLAAGTGLMTFTSVWLAMWGNKTPTTQKERYYPAVYGGLVAVTFVVALWRSIAFFLGSMRASRKLHFTAFSKVLRAPIGFFDATPAGRILNRFSKDMGLIDDMLPATFFDFSSSLTVVIATVILVVIVNPWVLICLPPLGVAFFFLRRYYMQTARVVKRIESTTRSPIYSIMNEVLTGLPVIRAFGMQGLLWKKYEGASDANLRAYFAFLATSRWVGFRLDMICLVLLAVAAYACVAARNLASPALVGLILSQILTLAGAFQWTVRQSAEVENQMVSVERIIEYTNLPTEDVDIHGGEIIPLEAQSLPTHWPRSGTVSFDNLVMRYRDDLPPVLRGVSCSIGGGMKVGVVGRTGAGKSSLLLALLRLVEPERRIDEDGAERCGVSIDGIDIAKVPLSRLRRSISTIPQDPVLYSGTIRSNLDPFTQHSDEECIQSLVRVQLDHFATKEGLSYPVAEGGSNLSVGQRQLICLSRALLRNSKIILMDEATANVDADTDAAIQHAIRHAFQDATVITIAHRLATVIDGDAILVLDHGQVLEYGHPHELLQNDEGALTALVNETGAKTASLLKNMAGHNFSRVPAA